MPVGKTHFLAAASNCRRLISNITGIVDSSAITALEKELIRNVSMLVKLGDEHLDFAKNTAATHWRQRMSRIYYSAYSYSRAIRLSVEGNYSQNIDDHKNVKLLPDDFPNAVIYVNKLPLLREDRNLADYDHEANIGDLSQSIDDSLALVEKFILDANTYLKARGGL